MSIFRPPVCLDRVPTPSLRAWTQILLTSFILMGCAPQAILYPQPGMAIWKSGAGGSIEGRATLRSDRSGYARSCAGFDAYIVPVTPETTAFIRTHFDRVENGYAPSMSLQETLGSFITRNGGGRVSCRDDGTFIFAELAAGQYYVLADIKWLLRWAHEGGTVSSVADVSGTRSTSVAIDVSLNTPRSASDASR